MFPNFHAIEPGIDLKRAELTRVNTLSAVLQEFDLSCRGGQVRQSPRNIKDLANASLEAASALLAERLN